MEQGVTLLQIDCVGNQRNALMDEECRIGARKIAV